MEGGVSPNPPTVLASGGPSGTDDAFLRNVSSGSNGAGGKWIMFNQTSDWTGNYLNAGVAKISMDVRNSDATEVHLRISFNGDGGGISSDSVFTIPADNIWRLIEFAIDPAHFITLNIGGDAALTLSAVNEFRILSNPQPELNGEAIAATIDIDNIRAENTSRTFEQPVLGGREVYPNPASGDRVHITHGAHDVAVSLDILNALGQVVQHNSLSYPYALDISDLENGLYFLVMDRNEVVRLQILR
jgi:hypothetical protein